MGASLSTSTIVKPTGNVGLGYSHETETRGTVNKQAGIRANQISGEIQDLNLQAGYIVNKGEPRDFNVKGQVNSTVLHDRHDKDGGSAGVSIGANENGVSALNLRGRRAEQKHYAATQKSTLAGVNPDQSKIVGQVEKILASQKKLHVMIIMRAHILALKRLILWNWVRRRKRNCLQLKKITRQPMPLTTAVLIYMKKSQTFIVS